ncbi:hypothetical protein FB446DRAFT_727831 [Lentinula raphanica]|nr:hypothetical protein FB446DRAFT_727831 [Lentinula raphanica]
MTIWAFKAGNNPGLRSLKVLFLLLLGIELSISRYHPRRCFGCWTPGCVRERSCSALAERDVELCVRNGKQKREVGSEGRRWRVQGNLSLEGREQRLEALNLCFLAFPVLRFDSQWPRW